MYTHAFTLPSCVCHPLSVCGTSVSVVFSSCFRTYACVQITKAISIKSLERSFYHSSHSPHCTAIERAREDVCACGCEGESHILHLTEILFLLLFCWIRSTRKWKLNVNRSISCPLKCCMPCSKSCSCISFCVHLPYTYCITLHWIELNFGCAT